MVGRLNAEIRVTLTQPEMRAQLAREGSDVIETTPDTFARFVQAESRKYAGDGQPTGLSAACCLL
jgi:hypothetical protein